MTAGHEASTLVLDMEGDRRVSGTEHRAAARRDQVRVLRRRLGALASTSHGQVDFETASTTPSQAAAALHPSDQTPWQSCVRAAAAAAPLVTCIADAGGVNVEPEVP